MGNGIIIDRGRKLPYLEDEGAWNEVLGYLDEIIEATKVSPVKAYLDDIGVNTEGGPEESDNRPR